MNSLPVDQNTDIRTTEVTSAMDAILGTDKFMASPQMSAFLRYVIEQTLIGNTRRIKAFTVGIEALGKPASFDPQTDPSVRVLAKRLRSSLDVYYEQNTDTEIFIELKPGSYVPKFYRRTEMTQGSSLGLNSTQSPMHTTAYTPPNAETPPLTQQELEHQHGELAPTTPTNQEVNQHSYAATSSNTSHLNVQQPQQSSNSSIQSTENTAGTQPHEDEEAKREAKLSQLWNAYKSTSKVA